MNADWDLWYPGKTTLGPVQSLNEELNNESYPFGLFACANDIISHCIFMSRIYKPFFIGHAEVGIHPIWPPYAIGQRKIASFEDVARVSEALAELATGKIEVTRENAAKAVERFIGLPAFSLGRDGLLDKQSLWRDTLVQ